MRVILILLLHSVVISVAIVVYLEGFGEITLMSLNQNKYEPEITEFTYRIDKTLVRDNPPPLGGKALLTDDIKVQLRNKEKKLWAINVGGGVLASDFMVEYEPMPSEKSEEFLERTRFTLQNALNKAEEFIALHTEYKP